MKLTKPQQKSLLTKWLESDQGLSFLEFRRGVITHHAINQNFSVPSYVVFKWCGTWLCIEPDGYLMESLNFKTHS
jgi:hypothetical protein